MATPGVIRPKVMQLGLVAVVAMMLGTAPAVAGPTDGGDGHAIAAGGLCSGRSVWVLKARVDEQRIVLGYGVHSRAAGEVWRVRIGHNGEPVFVGAVKTNDSGSFVVRLKTRNALGVDAFRARAVNGTTGELCAGGLAIG